ncbi:MAG: alanine--glyoxylate aminotransferase family protein [Chloroflexi bacterium]|nr:MAG: alanine--glyoxylate aminotransferase family protein [Chloroflexota bacterium]
MRVPETLLIPGPVSVSSEVLTALARPVPPHYGDEWVELYHRLTSDLAGIFGTAGDVVLLFGPGTAALETCLASALAAGDEVLVGEREPIRPEDLAGAIERHPAARAFAVVHHETSLGLLNPVRELCELASGRGLLTVVDAVASLGGVPLEMDAWGIDLCAGVGNKCLGAPVGVAPIAVGPRGWAAVDDGRRKIGGWYLNLATWRRYGDMWAGWHPSPTTMPSNVCVALAAALEEVLERGLEAHQARIARAAARVRDGLRELGFEMVIPEAYAAPITTAVWAMPGMDVHDYIEWLAHERGLRLGAALGDLAGKAFRVGHMGRAAEPGVVDLYLRATSEYLASQR